MVEVPRFNETNFIVDVEKFFQDEKKGNVTLGEEQIIEAIVANTFKKWGDKCNTPEQFQIVYRRNATTLKAAIVAIVELARSVAENKEMPKEWKGFVN